MQEFLRYFFNFILYMTKRKKKRLTKKKNSVFPEKIENALDFACGIVYNNL